MSDSAEITNAPLRWYRRLTWLGILINLTFAIPAMFSPDTLITMLGDTTASGEALRAIENHGTRPEVRDALSLGEGSYERFSTTARERQMYVAVHVRHQGRLLGVARASLGLARVEMRTYELRRSLVIALLFVLLLTSGLAWWLSRPLAAPMKHLLEGAHALARGDLTRRIHEDRDDEFGQVARVLNQAAFGIQEQ